MKDKNEHINWSNISNETIKNRLEEYKHEHESLKIKIHTLTEKLLDIEKEYLLGNTTLNNRHKGIE